MTCFWSGVLSLVNVDDLKKIGWESNRKPDLRHFILMLQNNNINIDNVAWNGVLPSERQAVENYVHVRYFDAKNINHGYDCSTFDPFLFLVCELFGLDVDHHFRGNIIEYRYIGVSEDEKGGCIIGNLPSTGKKLVFSSSSGHFSSVKRE